MAMASRQYWLIGLVVVLAAWLAPAPVPAADARDADHALLVGVSEYPHLGQEVQLEGPQHDVILWRDFLRQRGMGDASMQVLADGVEGAGEPTRAAILEALDQLAEEVEEGDFVFMLFAGHGTQQPATEATIAHEPDGLDELFLPRDASGWDASSETVDNAIIDAEFKEAIEAIRSQGAFVWSIFDTCHSGTMTRAVQPDGVRYRRVSPQSLGIPRDALNEARNRATQGQVRTRGRGDAREASVADFSTDLAGGLVAFYAAQSTQETPELQLPRGSQDSRPHGLFSYTLYQVLSQSPAASYRQVIQGVTQRVQRESFAAVPMAEGTALDRGVFGAEANPVRQWRVTSDGRNLELAAGELQEIGTGSILSIVPEATSGDDELIGHVEVTSADLVSADVEPVEFNGVEAPEILDVQSGSFARPVRSEIDLSLRIALREGRQGGETDGAAGSGAIGDVCQPPADTVRDAVARIRQSQQGIARRLNWVDEDNPDANAWLCQVASRLYIVDGNTRLDDNGDRPLAPSFPVSADAEDRLAADLADALQRTARVHNLLRVAQHAAPGDASLQTQLFIRRRGPDDADCARLTSTQPPEGGEAREPGVPLELAEGDCLSLVVTNEHPRNPVDVTILFVDSDYGIHPLWPTSDQLHNTRVEAGGRIAIGEFGAVADARGQEQLIVLGVPVDEGSQPIDLRFLAQASIPQTRSAADSSYIEDVLKDAGFSGMRSRGLTSGGGGAAQLEAVVSPFRVVPRQ